MHPRNWTRMLLLSLLVAGCGPDVSEEAYDGEAAPPTGDPSLEAAATSGPSVTVQPDSGAAAQPQPR